MRNSFILYFGFIILFSLGGTSVLLIKDERIDFYGHLGGFITGILIALVILDENLNNERPKTETRILSGILLSCYLIGGMCIFQFKMNPQ